MAAAKAIKEMFHNKIREAVDANILTKERGAQLIENAKREGYFPRVYDKTYMASKAGQEAWSQMLKQVSYGNEITAKKAAMSIMGIKNVDRVSHLIEEIPGTRRIGPDGKPIRGTGQFKLVDDVYKNLWEKSMGLTDSGMSSHLEKDRSLPKELEPYLQHFMVQDVDRAMSTYSHDVNVRLEFAKSYGEEHGRFARTYYDMGKIDPAVANSFKEAYFRELGDPRSWGVQTFLKAPEWTRKTASVAKALQVAKLTFSPITNTTQNPINSAVFLASKTGWNGIGGVITPVQAMRIWMESFFKSYAAKFGMKALQDEAAHFGVLQEHIYADIAGRMSDASPMARALDKVPIVGNLIRDPGTWLKYNGFNWTEDVNRIGGYHTGKQYILQLLKNKQALLDMGPGRFKPQKLDKINAALEELGIDKSVTFNKARISDVENGAWIVASASSDMQKAIGLGAQRVSNMLNFVDDAHEMPHFYNSFLGKTTWQLKRFSYGQGVFANEHVIKPFLKGNIAPLAVYMGAGVTAGLGVNQLRKWVYGDDRKATLTRQIMDAQSNVASFGIAQSLMESTTYGTSGVLKEVVGPGISQGADLAAAAGSVYNAAAYQNKFTLAPIARTLLSDTSVPGKRYLLNQLTPNKDIFEAKAKASGIPQTAGGKGKISYAPFEQKK